MLQILLDTATLGRDRVLGDDDATWAACFGLANELVGSAPRIARQRWSDACAQHLGALQREQADALFNSGLLFGEEDEEATTCGWETLALVLFVQLCGEPAAPSTAMEWPSSSSPSSAASSSPRRRRSDTLLSCIATAARRPAHRARWFGRHAGHFLEILHPRRLASLSACAALQNGGAAAKLADVRADLTLSRAEAERALELACEGTLNAGGRVPCANAKGQFAAVDVALWIADCVAQKAAKVPVAAAGGAAGAAGHPPSRLLEFCNATGRTVVLSSDLEEGAMETRSSGSGSGSDDGRGSKDSAALRSAVISGCDSCFIYALMPFRTVHVVGCAQCTIVVGAVAKTIVVEGCSELRIMCCCKQLRVISSSSSSFYLYSPPHPPCRPVLMGDNRGLSFAPYNVTQYTALRHHLERAGIAVPSGGGVPSASWANPIVIGESGARPRSSLGASSKRGGVADGSGSSSSSSSACWRRLPASQFAQFVVPFNLRESSSTTREVEEEGAAGGARVEKEKTSCGSEGNLFASEWAIEYRSTVERQTSNAQLIREKIAASGLSGERQAELVDAVEAKLWVRLSGGFAYYGLRSPNLCLLLSSSLLLLLFYFFFFFFFNCTTSGVDCTKRQRAGDCAVSTSVRWGAFR